MTLKYRILKKVMLAINFRSRFDKDEADMIAFAKKLNAKMKVPALTDKQFGTIKTASRFFCLPFFIIDFSAFVHTVQAFQP